MYITFSDPTYYFLLITCVFSCLNISSLKYISFLTPLLTQIHCQSQSETEISLDWKSESLRSNSHSIAKIHRFLLGKIRIKLMSERSHSILQVYFTN